MQKKWYIKKCIQNFETKIVTTYLPQAVVLIFTTSFRYFFSIDQMSSTPVTLNKSPRSGYIDSIPTITKSIVFELNARLITSRFRITLYNNAVQTSITKRKYICIDKICKGCLKKHQFTSMLLIIQLLLVLQLKTSVRLLRPYTGKELVLIYIILMVIIFREGTWLFKL